MTKVSINKNPSSWKSLLLIVATVVFGFIAGYGVDLAIRPTENKEELIVEANFTMELSDEQIPAVIETEEGEVETIVAPTVESIDSDQLTEECGEDEECGRGWYVDTSTPQTFEKATYGLCVDTDGHYGSQCWDLGNLFWQNYAGRTFSTCGTGAAKGSLNCYEKNAGNEFEMVWDATKLQAGDWVIFTNGTYGHVGMALGGYNNGYIALLGTNQGGKSCAGGGSTTNVINISLKNFGGAFRPKTYIIPEPTPEPKKEGVYSVVKGDTLGEIMKNREGEIRWGKEMDEYAKHWYSTKVKPGQSVYEGWTSKSGYGLFAGDEIEYRD